MECCIHNTDSYLASESELKTFTRKTFHTLGQYVEKWSQIDLVDDASCNIAKRLKEDISSFDIVPSDLRYHLQCYQTFTNSVRVVRAEKPAAATCEQATSSGYSKSQRSLRSTDSGSSTVKRNKYVLPVQCIICKRKDKWYKRKREKLCLCETMSGGKIIEAATLKGDDSVLRPIGGRDCVAVEVRYHHSCYREYTRFISEPGHTSIAEESTTSAKQTAFATFCSEVIENRIIEHREILRLTDLNTNYTNLVNSISGIGEHFYISNYNLKRQLLNRYATQLHFIRSSASTKSDIVMATAVTAHDLVEDVLGDDGGTSSASSLLSDDEPQIPVAHVHTHAQNTTRELFHAAKTLRRIVQELTDDIHWPPSTEDLQDSKIMLPQMLHNFLVWLLTESCDISIDSHLPISASAETKIKSIGQDIIYAVSNGRKRTVKHISLAVLIKNLTGSAALISIMNKFGHTVSYHVLQAIETALAEKHIANSIQLGVTIPPNISHGTFAVFCWDNIDILEETMSGSNTTHCTNGIVIQRASQEPQVHVIVDNGQLPSTSSQRNITKHRVLKSDPQSLAVMPYYSTNEVNEEMQQNCEKFVINIYGGSTSSIDELRYKMFCLRDGQSHQLPPTKDALKLHVIRSNYQACIWKNADCRHYDVPSPVGHGWHLEDGEVRAKWVHKPPAPLSLMELVSCGCTVCSSNKCSCKRNGLKCTDACKCGEECANHYSDEQPEPQGSSDDTDSESDADG